MVNVAILNLKDILKFVFKFAIAILIILGIININKFFKITSSIKFIETTIPSISYIEKDKKESKDITDINSNSFIEYILGSQLAMRNHIIKKDSINLEQEIVENDNITNDEVQINPKMQVVTENNIATNYTNQYKTVEVKNSSKYGLTEEILTPNIELENKKDILIFHTHTTESYTPSDNFQYTMTGNFRTTDLNYSVSRVGDELERHLVERRL